MSETMPNPSRNPATLKRQASNYDEELEQPKIKKIDIITPSLVAALDRTGTSSRDAAYILTAAAASLGHNIDAINLSRTTIHRKRIKLREKMATQFKDNLKMAKLLVLHWDGKLLPENEGLTKTERLPIVVTGLDTEQLLGVLRLDSGSGKDSAIAIIETFKEWNVLDRLKALCSDTTSCNTGRYNGTCTLLEPKLNKSFLHLACCHHMYELILKNIVQTYWKETSGRNMAIFQRLQQNRDEIDKSQYKTGKQDELIAETLEREKDDLLAYISDQLEVSQPRGDYRESLDLATIFLGGIPPRGITFKRPGANHRARWLLKTIYCF